MRVGFFFRRQGLEKEQMPIGIELKINHARERSRWIGEGDDMGGEGIAPKAVGTHFAGTLPKPIAENRRLFGKHAIPLWMLGTILLEVSK